MKKPRDNKKLAARESEELHKILGFEKPANRTSNVVIKNKKQPISIDKDELRRLLDPIDGIDELPLEVNLDIQKHLKKLENVAFKINEKRKTKGYYFTVDQHLNFILADDKHNLFQMLAAIICRAYWRYRDFLAAHNAKEADLTEALFLTEKIKNALDCLRDEDEMLWHKGKIGINPSDENVLARACGILARDTISSKVIKNEILRDAFNIIRSLHEFEVALTHFSPEAKKGRPVDPPYLFFVMRLCEVWILLTGKLPDPDYSPSEDRGGLSRNSHTDFQEFICTALKITKLGVEGLNRALRIISGKESHIADSYSVDFKAIKPRMNKLIKRYGCNISERRRNEEYPSLISHDWLNHYHLMPEPTSYVTSKPNPDWKGYNR